LKAGVRLPPDARELFEQIRTRVVREAEVARVTTTSAGSRRLAYVALQRVANESSAGKGFIGEVQALQQKQAAALKERNDRLTGIRATLAASSGPTADALKKEEVQVSQEVERFTADAKGELQALQTRLQNAFEAQITPVLGALATEWKLDVILNSAESGLVWADPALDVTGAVIDRLDGRPTQSVPPGDFRGAAFVQLQRIANESLDGKAATGEIQALQQKKSAELTLQNQQLRGLQLKLEKDGAALSASAQADLQKQIERLQVDIQRLTEDAQREISALQERLEHQFQTRIQPILAQTGQEKRLQLIFSGADSGLVWADSALDLSADIIKKLDASTKPLVK
jgi:outer membrane protein